MLLEILKSLLQSMGLALEASARAFTSEHTCRLFLDLQSLSKGNMGTMWDLWAIRDTMDMQFLPKTCNFLKGSRTAGIMQTLYLNIYTRGCARCLYCENKMLIEVSLGNPLQKLFWEAWKTRRCP
jgi:hypothetical protein